MSETLPINFKEICKQDSIILAILGGSGSGKTTMLKHILNETKKIYTNVFLFQASIPSEDNNYSNYIWPGDSYYEKNPEDKISLDNITKKVTNYIQDIVIINNNIKDENKKNDKHKIPVIKTLFVFDDFGSNNKGFSNITNISRHSYVSFIFLIHNDTDLAKSLRKKVTHFLVNVQFSLNQVFEESKDSKESKSHFEYCKNQFIEQKLTRCFLMIKKDDLRSVDYCYLTEDQVKKLKDKNKNTVFYKVSKERKFLKEVIMDIYKDELKKLNK